MIDFTINTLFNRNINIVNFLTSNSNYKYQANKFWCSQLYIYRVTIST